MNGSNTATRNFFKHDTFKNPNSAGFLVWAICLLFGNLFISVSGYDFKIAAIILSLIVEIIILIDSRDWKKPLQWLIAIGNAALIFINASGINSITYSSSVDRVRFSAKDSAAWTSPQKITSNVMVFANQKDWWPDNNSLNQLDTFRIKNGLLSTQNERLQNHYSWLQDYLRSHIRHDTIFTGDLELILGKGQPAKLGATDLDTGNLSDSIAQLHSLLVNQQNTLRIVRDSIKYLETSMSASAITQSQLRFKLKSLLDSQVSNSANGINSQLQKENQQINIGYTAVDAAADVMTEVRYQITAIRKSIDSPRSKIDTSFFPVIKNYMNRFETLRANFYSAR